MRTVTVKDVVLGPGRPAVIVPLTGRTLPDLLSQAAQLREQPVDVVEWRVDRFAAAGDLAAVLAAGGELAGALDRPLLVTLRTAAEGGRWHLGDAAYGDLLTAVVGAGWADLVDVELFRPDDVRRGVQAAAVAAGVKVVMSSHDFAGTPPAPEIVDRVLRMQELGADLTKVAVTPADAGDVLTLLRATWTLTSGPADRPLIAIAMGGVGVITRLAGEVFGSVATFAALEEPSAPGQVPLPELGVVLDLVHRALGP